MKDGSTWHRRGDRVAWNGEEEVIVLGARLILPALFAASALCSGCASDQVVSTEDIARQNRADGVVSQALFARRLDDHASYHVHPDGFVVIKFDPSVTMPVYTEVVQWLRAQPEIKGVRATQMGVEVCPLEVTKR